MIIVNERNKKYVEVEHKIDSYDYDVRNGKNLF